MNSANLTDFQKDQLLAFFAHYMPMDMRERLMSTLPRAYNAWCGCKVVEVVNISRQEPVDVVPDRCESYMGQKH